MILRLLLRKISLLLYKLTHHAKKMFFSINYEIEERSNLVKKAILDSL